MPVIILIPFAVFFVCCAAQVWFLAQVRKALIDRHSDFYLNLERSSMFPQRGLFRFIRSGQHKELRDYDLTSAVIRCRILHFVAIGSWLCVAATMVFVIPQN